MRDEIVRAITGDGLVKAVAVTGRDVVEWARNIHKLLPMSTAALGRALLGASMRGDMLKEEQGSLTLQIKGGGPLGTILAVSDYEGNVRGYVQHPQVDLMEKYRGKLDVGAAVGTDGTLTVIKDIGLKEPYVGSIALMSGEIADDLALYFVESEQIPTACALGVLVGLDQSVTAAGGYLIQLLPGAGDDIITRIEQGVHALGSVSHALAGGLDGEGLLRAVLEGFQLEILEKHPVEYRCYCSRDRVTRARFIFLIPVNARSPFQFLIHKISDSGKYPRFVFCYHRLYAENIIWQTSGITFQTDHNYKIKQYTSCKKPKAIIYLRTKQ